MNAVFSINTYARRTSSAEWSILVLVVLLGASLRFWGLSNIGLHGDEETMGLAVKGILEFGSPILPSGMYYARGLAQTFVMAASAEIFGLTEWALRFPSAVAGTAMIVASYFLGRRFLPADWSLIFALIIALLPAFISASQTARMYVFYVTFVVIFATTIFRWERTESYVDYTLAFVAFLIALHFHRLSVFSAFLFFWPGIIKASARLFAFGCAAFVASIGAYKFASDWTGSFYFTRIDFSIGDERATGGQAESFWFVDIPFVGWLLFGIIACLATVFCILAVRSLVTQAKMSERIVISLFWAVAILSAALMQHHLALICLSIGTTLHLRCGGRVFWPTALAGIVLLLAALQIVVHFGGAGFDQPKEILMTMLGRPNPWPYLRFAAFFPIAVVAYSFVFAYFIVSFVRGGPIPDHVLLVLTCVWLPIFLIGLFEGHIPMRYILAFVPFFILSALSGLRALLAHIVKHNQTKSVTKMVLTTVVLLVFISPAEFWYNVHPRYKDYSMLGGHRGADHKGASDFIRSLDIQPSDIIMAEDVLQQTYYLGKVDYWLRKFTQYTYLDGNVYSDIYTGTPHVGNAKILQSIVDQADRGDIFIIGSAETARDPKYYLGDEILMRLENIEMEVIYEGRDGMTRVLRVPAQSIP